MTTNQDWGRMHKKGDREMKKKTTDDKQTTHKH